MKVKMNDESYDYYTNKFGWHKDKQHEAKIEKPSSLTLDVKNRVIGLLFGTVSGAVCEELHKYMDARFEQCHSLALYITDADRKKSDEEKSNFAVLCEKLGLDPGTREVQVTDKLQVLYSHHYTVPGQPR